MPIILCPNCGHKMLSLKPTCPSCGYPLPMSSASTGSAASAPLPPPMIATPPPSSPFAPVPFGTYSPSTYGTGSPPVPSSAGAYAPVPVPTPSVPAPLPTSSPAVSTGVPNIEGMIVDPPTTSELLKGRDWSELFLGCIFLPVILVVSPMLLLMRVISLNGGLERKVIVTRIRVRLANGVLRDARFEGDIRGASISQGDHVALWGREDIGTLVVTRGHNYTSRGDIQVRQRHVPVVARSIAIFILLIMAFVLLSSILSSLH